MSLRTRDDLSRAYTPGVARVCLAIAENPADARRLTIKRNTVAVVTDGSAVLGLGNIGPAAALPVMEGKAALFKQFAGVDAWPVCLDTQDTDADRRASSAAIAPVYGGINLEDIAAPRCFEIEARLREILDIPVFHDDQHGTAIVVAAALRNALRVDREGARRRPDRGVRRRRRRHRDHQAAAGAGRQAHRRLRPQRRGASGQPGRATTWRRWLQHNTNPDGLTGITDRRARGCRRVHRGVRAEPAAGDGHRHHGDGRHRLRAGQPGARGRPDGRPRARGGRRHRPQRFPEPDQQCAGISRRFPRAAGQPARTDITQEMLIAAAEAIADAVRPEQLNPSYIVPSVFDPSVAPAVAAAIRQADRHRRVAEPIGDRLTEHAVPPLAGTDPQVRGPAVPPTLRPTSSDRRFRDPRRS